MEFVEYPKSLYRMGEHLIVRDRAEDEAALAEGFTDWPTDLKREAEAKAKAAEEAVGGKRKVAPKE